jgi:hypothetical protein
LLLLCMLRLEPPHQLLHRHARDPATQTLDPSVTRIPANRQ